jgi:hypothetical protein
MEGIKILDIFQQEADEGITSHYCVQYIGQGSTFVEYGYFATLTSAREFAAQYGYED